MSTVKFSNKPSAKTTPIVNPGKEEEPSPRRSVVSAFKNIKKFSDVRIESSSSSDIGDIPLRTISAINASKSNQVPEPVREARIISEPKGCPAVLTEEDLNRKMDEIVSLEENIEAYEVVGAEIAILDMDAMVKSNKHPLIHKAETAAGRGTLSDPRMGVVENNAICATCKEDNVMCPGHHGYIKLNAPVYHPLFVTLIPKILSSICITCGKLFFTEEQLKEKELLNYRFEKRITEIAAESANQMCQGHETKYKKKKPGEKYTSLEAAEAIQRWWRKLKGIKVKPCSGTQIQFVWNKDCKQIQAIVDDDVNVNGITFERYDSCEGSKKAKGRTVPVRDVESILKGINHEALRLMDFSNYLVSHPKNFIMHYLAVLPPISRQPKFTDNKVVPDKLTEQYKTIIIKNEAVAVAKKENKSSSARALYDEIDKFIQGSDSGKKGDFKSITRRIQGKKERIRDNMMAHRVNFSARTVLGPKPTLRLGQIAYPRIWAKQMRIKETVFSANQRLLQNYLEDGKIYFIFPKSSKIQGQSIFVDQKWRKSYKLVIGDVVERELMDGDYTIFNRQPSLHKQSMMAFQVVLHDELTTGLHIATTKAFNADFDGDEGNGWQFSQFMSRAEAMQIMNVKQCVMNAQTNRPLISPHFDAHISAYLLTDDKTKLSKQDFYQLLMSLTRQVDISRLERLGLRYGLITIENFSDSAPYDIVNPFTGERILKKGQAVSSEAANEILTLSMQPGGESLKRSLDFKPMYSGRLLFSAALPEDFYYEFYKKSDSGAENVVVIKQGILVSGRITSEILGQAHNSIVQALYKAYPRYEAFTASQNEGDTEVVKFITDVTFLLDKYLSMRGHTIGVEDCLIPEKDKHKQEKIIQDAIEENMRAAFKISKKLDNPLEEERREAQIRRYIDTAKAVGGKVSELLPSENSLLSIIRSGAKGNELNLSQITSMLGQMFMRSNRFPLNLTDNTRCIPYFEPGSLDVRSRGFCINSFLTGLTPAELFFSQASGRINLMDTALKTADVGDMHRRMNKIVEDLVVAFDGSVRNDRNRIFQFVYGEDGLDAAELQFVKSPGGDIPMFVDVFKEARKLNAKYEEMEKSEEEFLDISL